MTKEHIVQTSHRLIGSKHLGILLTRARLNTNVLVRSAALVVRKKQILIAFLTDDKGWYGKDKKVYNFFYDKEHHHLFIRKLAIDISFLN